MILPNKMLAILPAAVLAIALMYAPSYASAQGSCTVSGNGTAVGPMAERFSSVNMTNGVRIIYEVQAVCLDKGAAVNDTVNAAFDVNATCFDGKAPGSCATLPDLGTIGNYTAAKMPCNKNGTCSLGPVTVNSNATIPQNGTEVQILSGSATLTGLPGHGNNVVAHLGNVQIIPPSGFKLGGMKKGDDHGPMMGTPDFSIAFQAPKVVHIPHAACTVISSVLTRAGIPQATIQQILAQLGCS